MGDTDGGNDKEAAQGTAVPVKRRRRWPWILLASLVLLVVALRAALPSITERGAAAASRYWLGLPVHVDEATFDLRHGDVLLEGVTIGAAADDVSVGDALLHAPPVDAGKALLHLGRLELHLSWDELRQHTVHLLALSLDAPTVRVVRESDGTINPLLHARPLAPPPPPETAPAAPSQPWTIVVDQFALRTPDVQINDPATSQELLDFSLEKLALDHVRLAGADFKLGGVDIEGPKLRVRRDLVLARASAPANAPPAASNAAPAGTVADAAAAPDANAPAAPQPAGDAKPATPASAAETTHEARTASGEHAPAPPASAAGYHIEKIDIARATFTWISDKGPLDVAMTLRASDVSADQGKSFPIDLELEIGDGRLALNGNVGVLPPSYDGKLKWEKLPFPPLLLASLPDIAAWLHTASAGADLTIDADIAGAHGPPAIHLSGKVDVDTLAISDPGGDEVALGWKELDVAIGELLVPLPEPGKAARTTIAHFDDVRLVEPKILYTLPSPSLNALLGIKPASPSPPDAAQNGTQNVTKDKATSAPVTGKAGSAPAKASNAASKASGARANPPQAAETVTLQATPAASVAPAPVDVQVASLELESGDLTLVDTTVNPAVTSNMRQLAVSAHSVHFPDPSAQDIKVRAVLAQSSELAVDGQLRAGNNGDFTLSLKGLDLPALSPYASAAAGASLDAGQASAKSRVSLKGAATKIDTDLVLRNLGLSLHDPSSFDRQFGMPIDLALALLRNPAGDIHLTIPVTIDAKGAQVSTGAIIASALKDALVGAVTAPLKLLGAAFGGGSSGGAGGGFGVAPIASVPGEAEPGADAAARADSLAKLLAERPAMSLTLRGRTGAADRPLLAEQMLGQRVRSGKGLPDMKGVSFLAKRRLGQAFLARDRAAGARAGSPAALSSDDQALYDRYVAGQDVPAESLDALAKSRGEKVRELLLARKVAEGRVSVGARDADGDPGVVIGLAPAKAPAAPASAALAKVPGLPMKKKKP